MSTIPLNLEHAAPPLPSEVPSTGIPVALVCMPWGSVQTPSLAMAILKTSAQTAGFDPTLHFLNIRFAERLGLARYEEISSGSFFPSEWFFSQALFGPQALNEIRNDWKSLHAQPDTREMLAKLCKMTAQTEEQCQEIAENFVPAFIEECLSEIDWGRYMAVGFTTTFAQSAASLLLAKRIKDQWPHVNILFGGANVDSEMGVEFMRGFAWIDYVVHGEAEKSFPALLSNLAEGKKNQKIPGVSMRQGSSVVPGDTDVVAVVDLNESPSPDYSDYIRELDRAGFRKKMQLSLYYESSRGCWWGAKHHCTFCGLNGTTMALRKKTPERVYSEIVSLADNYRCLKLNAADNILPMNYFPDLLPKLAQLDMDMELFYEVKANLTRAQLKAMRAAGITSIQPGIESLNSRLLRLMRKGVTAIQNIQLIKWCEEIGISPGYNILHGFPGEEASDYEGLPELLLSLSHLRPPSVVTGVIFERFSPYHFERQNFGLELAPDPMYQHIFPESRVDLSKIAYFFTGTWKGQPANRESYLQPVIEATAQWREHRKKGVFCEYTKGPHYITITDNRPGAGPYAPPIRGLQLDELNSAVYLFCDENRSFHAILDMVRTRFDAGYSESKLGTFLDELVRRRLMFREGDRYLSLAIRAKVSQDARRSVKERD